MAASPQDDRDRFQRLEALFHRAREQPADRRAAFLLDACPDDESARLEVMALIEAHDRDGAKLEARAPNVAARLLASGESVPGPGSAAPHATPSRRPAPLWLYVLAAIFVADCLLRTWCHVFGPATPGYTLRYESRRTVIAAVRAGSAADEAG
jgi:hypothetical protein